MKPFENALPGFNHNIKHKGQLYHIQTEDSGRHNPTVTTLLFLGGNILASLKASYADCLSAEGLPARVRSLMENQHKQMLRNLLKGHYDKNKEVHSRHWKVGQLDETIVDTAKHQALPSTEPPPAPLLPLAPLSPLPPLPPRPSRPLPALEEIPPPSQEEEELKAVFGEDLTSEKRLDELIFNYLLREKDKLR